ncbi:MBL fold metallo-hydrolase [Aureibacillus halotolerans]|nr:MBL fold metallo-hydrolase [Aureibacillus halotolerans]
MIQYEDGRLRVFQSALYCTTSTVMQMSNAVVVIDPTWLPEEVQAIRQYVDTILNGRELYLVFTHNDFDHILGAGAFPEATTIATQTFATCTKKEQVLQEISAFDNTFYLQRPYQVQYPDIHLPIQVDGQELHLEDRTLQFYLAPGHTADGLFIVDKTAGLLVAGDYFSNVEFPFIEDSYSAYVKTVEKAMQLFQQSDLTMLIPGHGHLAKTREEAELRMLFAHDYLQRLPHADEALANQLRETFPFYDAMKKTHQKNIVKAQNERQATN